VTRRLLFRWLVTGTAAVAVGCSTPWLPRLPWEEAESPVSAVGVMTGDLQPGAAPLQETPAPGSDRAGRAAGGAAIGAGAGLVVSMISMAACLSGALFTCTFAWAPVAAGAAVGGVVGAATGGAGPAQPGAHYMRADEPAQRGLVDAVVGYGNIVGAQRFDAVSPAARRDPAIHDVLETTVFRYDPPESDGYSQVYLQARARLVRSTEKAVADRSYFLTTLPRSAPERAEDDGARVAADVERGYRLLAQWMVDDLFLPHADQARVEPESPLAEKCIGAPSPETCPPGADTTVALLRPARLDTLRPALSWRLLRPEAAPAMGAPEDAAAAGARFELRVFAAERAPVSASQTALLAGSTVYARADLTTTTHVLEEELPPCARYLWTVRAMLEEAAGGGITEWAGAYEPSNPPAQLRSTGLFNPFDFAYPFETPCPVKTE
jgi:hypothetical protein